MTVGQRPSRGGRNRTCEDASGISIPGSVIGSDPLYSHYTHPPKEPGSCWQAAHGGITPTPPDAFRVPAPGSVFTSLSSLWED